MKATDKRKLRRTGLLLGLLAVFLTALGFGACEPEKGFDYWQFVEPAEEHEDEHHDDEHDGGMHDGGMDDGGMDDGGM